MSEKGPLILKSSNKRVVVNTIAGYWEYERHIRVLTKSGQIIDLYFGDYKKMQKAMDILDNYFIDIMETEDE